MAKKKTCEEPPCPERKVLLLAPAVSEGSCDHDGIEVYTLDGYVIVEQILQGGKGIRRLLGKFEYCPKHDEY